MTKRITIDNLAAMVMKGFNEVHGKFDEMDNKITKGFDDLRTEMDRRFERVDERFDHINARLSNVEKDVSEIRRHFVYRHEFEDLMSRVKYLEEKLGIESGK